MVRLALGGFPSAARGERSQERYCEARYCGDRAGIGISKIVQAHFLLEPCDSGGRLCLTRLVAELCLLVVMGMWGAIMTREYVWEKACLRALLFRSYRSLGGVP